MVVRVPLLHLHLTVVNIKHGGSLLYYSQQLLLSDGNMLGRSTLLSIC